MAIREDKEALRAFVQEVYAWLEDCHTGEFSYGPYPNWRVVEPLRLLQPEARLAWVAFQERQSLDSLQAAVSEASEAVLYRNGLYGDQLKYKLGLLHLRARQASGGSIRSVEKFLDVIDLIMDSLLDALGVGEAIKELIKALRNQVR